MKPKKLMATNDEVKNAAELLRQGAAFCDSLGSLARDLATACDEVARFRVALRAGVPALDLAAFAEELQAEGDRIGEALAACKVEGLKLGRVTLIPRDGSDYALLSFERDRLIKLLSDRFKAPFRVQIKHRGW